MKQFKMNILLGLSTLVLLNSVNAQGIDTDLYCNSCIVKYPVVVLDFPCSVGPLDDGPIFIKNAGYNHYKASYDDLEFVIYFDSLDYKGHISGTHYGGGFSGDFVLSDLDQGDVDIQKEYDRIRIPRDLIVDSISNLEAIGFTDGDTSEQHFYVENFKLTRGTYYLYLPDNKSIRYIGSKEDDNYQSCICSWKKGVKDGPLEVIHGSGLAGGGIYSNDKPVGKWVSELFETCTNCYQVTYFDSESNLICDERKDMTSGLSIMERNYAPSQERRTLFFPGDYYGIDYYENGTIKSQGWFNGSTGVWKGPKNYFNYYDEHIPVGIHLLWSTDGICTLKLYD